MSRWCPVLAIVLLLGCSRGWSPPPTPDDDDSGDDDDVIGDDDLGDDDASGDDDTFSPGSDVDGDTIYDSDEGDGDQDGDGTPNLQDLDSDGDGFSDAEEAGDSIPATPPVDSDSDGLPDFLDLDSDGNGIDDAAELATDSDGDGVLDRLDDDDDGDGIPDEEELGPNPASPLDSDGDGTPDFRDQDSDGDGIDDQHEGFDDPDGDGIPSYRDEDSDGDGLSDASEVGDPSNPSDTDGDGFFDFEDADSDNDGVRDGDELAGGTDPHDRDTDGDGFTDGAELVAGTDPQSAGSVIDGYYAELNPRAPTTLSVPFTPEILQADVVFVLDTTCSMTSVLQDVANNFSQVVSGINIPDIAYAVTEFNDYAYDPGGGAGAFGYPQFGDKPFRLQQQLTTNTMLVQSALAGLLPIDNDGGDLPESSYEALFQAATGKGYDQDCDDVYDAATDVRPFIPIAAGPAGDAFGGTTAGTYQASVPGTGTGGGVGLRDGAVPIFVVATDDQMRDPSVSMPSPPMCSDPAGSVHVSDAMTDLGGRFIGVGTTSVPIFQMTQLANATSSLADIDGDGTNEPLVFQGLGSQTVTSVISGVEALANSGQFDLELDIDDSPYGFVTSIAPSVHSQVTVGTTVQFDVTLYPSVPQQPVDQAFVFPMQVIGDGGSVLAEWQLVLVVLAG